MPAFDGTGRLGIIIFSNNGMYACVASCTVMVPAVIMRFNQLVSYIIMYVNIGV